MDRVRRLQEFHRSMTEEEIRSLFPLLPEDFAVTSEDDENYNCVAWSINDTHRWWWPTPITYPCYWPPYVPRDNTADAFVTMYETLLFVRCESREPEDGYDKVALYVGSMADRPMLRGFGSTILDGAVSSEKRMILFTIRLKRLRGRSTERFYVSSNGKGVKADLLSALVSILNTYSWIAIMLPVTCVETPPTDRTTGASPSPMPAGTCTLICTSPAPTIPAN